jgi:hypothetical protein
LAGRGDEEDDADSKVNPATSASTLPSLLQTMMGSAKSTAVQSSRRHTSSLGHFFSTEAVYNKPHAGVHREGISEFPSKIRSDWRE